MRVVAVDRYAQEVGGVRVEHGPGDVFDLSEAEIAAEKARRYPRAVPMAEKSREQREREADAEFASRADSVRESLLDLAEEWRALPQDMREAERARVRTGLGWLRAPDPERDPTGEPLSVPTAFERLTGIATPEGSV